LASSIAFPTEVHPSLRRALAQGWRWLAIAGTAVVLAAAGLAVIGSHWFHVRSIDVVGADHLSRGEIVRLSGITKHDNAVWLDGSTAESRLMEDPWVGSADVRIDLPWTVTITVTERSPIAVLERGTSRVLVAGDGTLLGSAQGSEQGADLPLIEAPPAWIGSVPSPPIAGVARALAALDTDVRDMVRRIETGSPGGLELFLSDGLRISYGPARAFTDKATAIAGVLAWTQMTGEEIRLLDVSAPSAPAVTPIV
jgi:cell division septal protein FtsQ